MRLQKVSIPSGSIKAKPFAAGLMLFVKFQFHPVRLKQLYPDQHHSGRRVSIPSGSIKAACLPADYLKAVEFQFHPVRLKLAPFLPAFLPIFRFNSIRFD